MSGFFRNFASYILYVNNMQVKKKVLFINTETAPYVAETALSEMGKIVPERIQGSGCEIRTFMPKWGGINERRGQLHEVIRLSGMNIIIDGTDHPLVIKVASIPVSRVQVYFIDNDDYFLRKGIKCDENGNVFDDNGERAIFYARGVLETVKKLRWIPDIIHCQGWMSGIVPFYIRKAYQDEPCFRDSKIISAIYSEKTGGSIGDDFKKRLAFKDIDETTLKEYKDDFDFTELGKLAIDYSDGIIEMEGNVNPELKSYAQAAKKPILEYPGEDFLDSYKEFYNQF